ncbi:MAG: DUF992 domain-containing protein [Pseudomonadota bacterium]
MTRAIAVLLPAAAMVAAVFGAPAGSTAQEAKVVAGTLTCQGKGSVGLIIGSKQTLACKFDPAGKTPPQSYNATITKVGLDIGIKGPSVMVWTVLSATSELPAGALAGNYAGVSAEASVAVGAGANALVGGAKNSVVLQPLSVQGQTGLNLAVGVAGLKLSKS